MKCDLCNESYETSINMQTVAAKMVCHICLAEAIKIYLQIKKGIYRMPPSKMEMGY